MNKNNKFLFNPLAIVVLASLPMVNTWSLQPLNDDILSAMTAQDGLDINLQNTGISIDQAYWQDNNGTTDRKLQLNHLKTQHPTTAGGTIESNVQLQMGSNGTQAGIDLLVEDKTGSLTTVESVQLCHTDGTTCGKSLGAFAINNAANSKLHLATSDGLFNKDALATLQFQLPDLQIFYQQHQTGSVEDKNQLLVKIRLDAQAEGQLWIDSVEGLRFNGTVKLNPKTGGLTLDDQSSNGLSFGLFTRNKIAIDNAAYRSADSKPIIHIGMTGDLLNTDVYVRGTSDENNFLGTDVMGSSGLALRAKAELANGDLNSGSTSFSLDLSDAGTEANGVRFSKWVAFDDPSNNAYIDTGNIYINLVTAKDILLPINEYLGSAPTGLSDTAANLELIKRYGQLGITTDSNDNFIQTLDTIQDALLLSIRGLEFQGFATRGQFIGTGFSGASEGNWSLATMIYGGNANIALWGDDATVSGNTSERIGFDVGLSTAGRNEDGKKTTSLLLMDTQGTQANYIGLRNIDSFMRLQGSLALDNNKIRLNLPKFTMAISGELAAGCLPNRPCGSGAVTETGYFNDGKDNLMGVRLKLQSAAAGSATNFFELVAADSSLGGYLGYNADLSLADSYLRLVEPTDGSQLALDKVSGRLKLTQGQLTIQPNPSANPSDGDVTLAALIDINPDCPVTGSLANCVSATTGNKVAASAANYQFAASEAFRIGEFNLYPSPTVAIPNPTGQKLGEVVMTGGKMFTQFSLTPR
ncbi:DUF6160 family protein [Acinetobacter puyangensis]|uniref:DUF6160 family protein n=1 Tax=Acinetobacter puyangensis TaxID=1096779 RepID=UPI003A4D675E